MGGKELDYVNEAFAMNWIAPLGPNVNEFEKVIGEYLKEEVYVAALSSGTAAIHLGLDLLGVSYGDEVICQSFTFSASANPIAYLGAKPVFVDSDKTTWNICPELLEETIVNRIKAGKKPKAIIAVHLYGMPYQIKEVTNVANKYDIPVLEDSAEALGSTYYGIKCGTFGDIGILSFNGNKIITTSGGGALVTGDKKIRDRAIFLATQARDTAPHYQHSNIGYNYRMSNVVAGIGRGQMEDLNERVAARRANYDFYRNELKDYGSISFLEEPAGYFSNRWLTCITTSSYDEREKIRLALDAENIESRPLWKPLHLQPVFKGCKSFTNGVSETLFDKGLCLPSGSNLSEGDLQLVTDIIKKNTI